MISIIVPALNEEDVIEGTLDQFKNISLPHEVIVSDGGSKDRTVEIAKGLADKVVVHKGGKQTIAKNRNNGAKIASGEYLAFVDSGVVIPDIERFFKRALEHFEKNKNLVGLTAGIHVFPDSATFGDKFIFGIMNFNFLLLNNVFHVGIAQGKFQMVKRAAFQKAGGFREDLVAAEDQALFYNLSKIGRTLIDMGLKVYHSGRRAHTLGWPRLLLIWWRDSLWLLLFNRTYSQNWERAVNKKK